MRLLESFDCFSIPSGICRIITDAIITTGIAGIRSTTAFCLLGIQVLLHGKVVFLLPLLVCHLVTLLLVSHVPIIYELTVGEVSAICPLAVVVIPFGIISTGKVISLGKICVHAVHVPAVLLVLHLGHQRSLVIQLLSLLVVLVQCHTVEFRYHFIQLLQICLVCLLTDTLTIGAAITAGQRCCLPHVVHHCQLALACVLICILLIQSILVHIIGEFLPVQNLLDRIIQLPCPCRLVLPGLLCHLLLQQSLCLRYSFAGRIVSIGKGRGCGLRLSRCSCCSTASVRRSRSSRL